MAHDCSISNGPECCGMDRSTGDKLNKAYEAYRTVSIERDNAQRALQQKTECYKRHIQHLLKRIDDQDKQISELKAQLSSAREHASEDVKCCEAGHREQEVETLSPRDHHPDNLTGSHWTNHLLEAQECLVMSPSVLPGAGSQSEEVLGTLQEIQGQFQQIQRLTTSQKDHLKRLYKGHNAANDNTEQQFSMPIQCTEVTAERAEVPFSSAARAESDERAGASGSLASRGVNPEDGDLEASLSGLSVRFPPPADSECLHSTPEKDIHLLMQRKAVPGATVSTLMEEELSPELPPMSFTYPAPSPPASMSSASSTHQHVRGPQQPYWSPELCSPAEKSLSEEPQQKSSGNCEFCKTIVPKDQLYSHLNSHFQKKASD